MLDYDEFDTVLFRCCFGALSGIALVYKGYFDVFTRHLLYLRGQFFNLSTLLFIVELDRLNGQESLTRQAARFRVFLDSKSLGQA